MLDGLPFRGGCRDRLGSRSPEAARCPAPAARRQCQRPRGPDCSAAGEGSAARLPGLHAPVHRRCDATRWATPSSALEGRERACRDGAPAVRSGVSAAVPHGSRAPRSRQMITASGDGPDGVTDGAGRSRPQVEFVGTDVAQATLRPRKLGYLVRAGNATHVRKAIAYACTEWAGVGQVIIPVDRRDHVGAAWWQILEQLRPEVLIDYAVVGRGLEEQIEHRVGSRLHPHSILAPGNEPGVHATVAVPPGTLAGRLLLVPHARALPEKWQPSSPAR